MQRGDEAAFLALYRRRQAGLYRFALRMTGSPTAAEDAVQETFLELLRRAANYDPARGSVSAFLYGIARNCVRRGFERNGDLLAVGDQEMQMRIDRRDGSSGMFSLNQDPAAPDALFSSAEQVEALRRAILTLPEHYREAVVLCDLEELSYVEAAEALDCAVGTVRSRLHRARAMLGERLRHLTADGAEGAAGRVRTKRDSTSEQETLKGSERARAVRPLECEA